MRFSRSTSERSPADEAAHADRAARTDPTFKQDLNLAIVGSIGDKLTVDVGWDTNNQFDYQNKLKLPDGGWLAEIGQKLLAIAKRCPVAKVLSSEIKIDEVLVR